MHANATVCLESHPEAPRDEWAARGGGSAAMIAPARTTFYNEYHRIHERDCHFRTNRCMQTTQQRSTTDIYATFYPASILHRPS